MSKLLDASPNRTDDRKVKEWKVKGWKQNFALTKFVVKQILNLPL